MRSRGILAHEVAHISNNDRFAMDWATSLQRAVAVTALAGLAAGRSEWGGNKALAAFLLSAPSIAQLLYLALSRSRELDADARALDLIDCPHALVAALNKLEHFHVNAQLISDAGFRGRHRAPVAQPPYNLRTGRPAGAACLLIAGVAKQRVVHLEFDRAGPHFQTLHLLVIL